MVEGKAELLGVRTKYQPNGPVGENFIPLEAGLTVLYGLNGSGKTRLLASIRDGELLVRYPIGEGPWKAGWRSPSDEFEIHGHLVYPEGEFMPFAIGQYMEEKDANYLSDIQEEFEDVNLINKELGGGIGARLWEIVLSTVGTRHVHLGRVQLVLGALSEIAKQSLFSFEPATRFGEQYYRVAHRVRIDSSTPNSQTICDLAMVDIDAAKTEEEDPYPLEVLENSNTGVGFLFLEEVGNRSGWGNTHGPWWFGSPTHRFTTSREFQPVQLITEDESDPNTLALGMMREIWKWPAVIRELIEMKIGQRSLWDLSAYPDRFLFQLEDGTLGTQEFAGLYANHLAESANRYFQKIFEAAPLLRLKINSPEIWDQVGRLAWEASDLDGNFIKLDNLSAAQLRWAKFSIKLALSEAVDDRPILVLLDEPEAGLHRRAERHLVGGLAELCEKPNVSVIVATHSPSFLRSDLAKLIHVRRDLDHKIVAQAMTNDIRNKMFELGLDPSDLLQLCRGILLVEGSHDVAVMDGLFGDILRNSGIQIFPMRGAKGLKEVVDAQLLFDFTDVPLTIMLDNSSTEKIEMLWNKACVLFDEDNDSDWLGALEELRKSSPGGEGKFLKEFCSKAIKSTERHRVQFAMLAAPDILDYLPIEFFLDEKVLASTGFTHWNEFRQLRKTEGEGDFKKWLTEKYGADFSIPTIERAVAGIASISADLTEILNRIAKIQGD
jgi:hypothetical protein